MIDKISSNQRPKNIPQRCVRIPQPHHEAFLALSTPVCHDSDHARPATALEDAASNLDRDEVPDTVDVDDVGKTKHEGVGS